jgi:FlgD Ig-like domain
MNALATKNVYTQSGFYNDFSILIDQSGIVRYKGAGVNVSSITTWIDNLLLTSIDEIESTVPQRITLHQNHPNPFNPITKIKFHIEKSQQVILEIFDVTGKLIRKLIDNNMNAGSHELFWDGRDGKGNALHSGIYFYSIKSGKEHLSKKMTLLR